MVQVTDIALDQLAAEAEQQQQAAEVETTAADETAGVNISPEQFADMVGGGVQALSNLACDRIGVTRLETDEVKNLATALTRLAEAYNALGQLDPKTAAWMNVGLVAAATVSNRRRIAPPQPAAPPAAAEPAAHIPT